MKKKFYSEQKDYFNELNKNIHIYLNAYMMFE